MAQITILGKVHKNIEMRYSKDGKSVVNFGITESAGKVNGEYKNNFWYCTAFSGTATMLEKYFHSGSPIMIVGNATNQKYNEQYRLNIIVEKVMFVPTEKNYSRQDNEKPEPQEAEVEQEEIWPF